MDAKRRVKGKVGTMYYPYLCATYPELEAIKSQAGLMEKSGFVPVIEPTSGLQTRLEIALGELERAGVRSHLIVNPREWEFPVPSSTVTSWIADRCQLFHGMGIGVRAAKGMTLDAIMALCRCAPERSLAIIHSGFEDSAALAAGLESNYPDCTHVFLEPYACRLYRQQFRFGHTVLIRDGRKPVVVLPVSLSVYETEPLPDIGFFSELHATFELEGVASFGDWLCRGDVHTNRARWSYYKEFLLTRVDAGRHDAMYLHRFSSGDRIMQIDVAIQRSLKALSIDELGAPFRERPTQSVRMLISDFMAMRGSEFRVRQLSASHHLECMADYFNGQG